MSQVTPSPAGEEHPSRDEKIGARIKSIRERTGRTRTQVAEQVGRSADWLKAIESGKRGAPGISTIMDLANVLGVRSLSEIIGDDDLLMSMDRRSRHPVVPAIREAIEGVELAATAPTLSPAELSARVEHAWRLWHHSPSPRADAGRMLPTIITEGHRAVRASDGLERRAAATALAGGYALSEQVLAWVADAPLLWMAADRCMAAAQMADEPVTLASAAWVLGNVWRATGREEDAYRLAQDAVQLLGARLDASEPARALWGSCQLHGAITAARMGREGDALRAMDEATSMARGVDAPHLWTLFGEANTELTAVSVQVELRRGAGAIDAAGAVDPDSIPSLDRRARLWLEMARAYALRKDWSAALGVLTRATSVSEESMRYHPLSRSLAGELVSSGGRLIERDARALASQLGVTV
jgi:transcriptional regulator with XRE-family HTH domain